MINFVKQLENNRNTILNHMLVSPANVALVGLEDTEKTRSLLYLSIVDDNYWITKIPTEKEDLKDELILTILSEDGNRSKIGTLKVLRYIDFCNKHMIATEHLELGFRYETMIWILSQKEPNSLTPKTNWFGEWVRPEGEKFSTPLNFDFSKKMLNLYKAGNFELMKIEWARYKDLAKNRLDQADKMNEERKFNILADNIRESKIEVVKERTTDYIETYIIDIPERQIALKKVYLEGESSDEFSELRLTEAIFRDVITKFEKQTRDECIWKTFMEEYKPSNKVLKYLEGSTIIAESEIIIEDPAVPFSAVLYELSCRAAKALDLGECQCNEHKTYNSRILTIEELKTYYDRT